MNTKSEQKITHWLESLNSRVAKLLVITLIILTSLSSNLAAQVYIRVCPKPPVHVRPAPPHPKHLWIDGDWVYNGRNYVWREGYWAAPKAGHRWIPGHWKNGRRGYKWVPGHWKR